MRNEKFLLRLLGHNTQAVFTRVKKLIEGFSREDKGIVTLIVT